MKTVFKISKGVICTNLPDAAIRKIEKDLSFDNPVYVNAMKQGRYISSDIPAELELFEIEKSKAWIPRGYIFYLLRWMKEHNHEYKVKDHTLLLKPLNLKFKGELRPYQMDAATDMLSYPIGVLDANTGCLIGDTSVRLNRGRKGFKCTLEHLYHKFNATGKAQGREWDITITTYIRSFQKNQNKILLNIVEKVIYSGIKKVYEFILEDGKTITATLDHRVLTNKGWKKFKDIKQYDKVMVDSPHKNFSQGIPKFVKVKSKKFIGEQPTYDICCKDPHNNFTANDIVVHNSGKTCIAIYIIVQRQQPTLIIVHSKELLYQWQEQIKKFTGEDCGLIGDGKFKIKPITVGIINTVKNKISELQNKFGNIQIDETHKIVAASYMDTLQEFPAKYYTGMTATAYRRDGLGHTIFASIGPKKHTISKQMLFDTKAVLIPEVFRIDTNFQYMFLNDYSTMIKKLTEDEKRNKLICSTIHADFRLKGESILIVSDRKKHLENMQEMLLNKYNDESLVLTGSTKKKERQQIVEEVKNGDCKILFASLSLIKEGFDLDKLTVLFLTTPIKFKGSLIQGIGRILRPDKNKKTKKPRVYDFRDNMVDVLKYSGYSRDAIYKKEWPK